MASCTSRAARARSPRWTRSSGDEVWRSAPTGFNIGPFGVAVDDALVYAVDGSEGVLALDRATGERAWSTDVTATATTGIDIQPVIAGELVLVSSVPVSLNGIYTGGDRGVVTALDRATGEVEWTFDTVLGEDLWGDPAVNSGGGAWYPPAVDSSGASCTSARPTRRRSPARPSTRTGRAVRATTSTPTRSSPSTSRPASCSGTTR